MDRTAAKVTEVASGAPQLYVGRTCNPERRRGQHFERDGRDQLFVLHSADDFQVVASLERSLIARLREHPRLRNRSPRSMGSANVGRVNHVYVSWETPKPAPVAHVPTVPELPPRPMPVWKEAPTEAGKQRKRDHQLAPPSAPSAADARETPTPALQEPANDAWHLGAPVWMALACAVAVLGGSALLLATLLLCAWLR